MYERVRFGNETFFLNQKKTEDRIQTLDNKISILTRVHRENVFACRLFFSFDLKHLRWKSRDIDEALYKK